MTVAASSPAPRPIAPIGRAAAIRVGIREALGAPLVVLAASYMGFGSLVRANDLGIPLALYSTLTGWALPGQVVTVELCGAGASLLVIGMAVALTNARLLPMVVTLVPKLARPGLARWKLYTIAHVIAVTTWIYSMRRTPQMAATDRLSYVAGFAGTLWATTLVATALGFLAAHTLPPAVSLGLVFLNPVYFLLLLLGEVGRPSRAAALVLGAIAGPLLHLVSPDWGLLISGLGAGSLAFLVELRFPSAKPAASAAPAPASPPAAGKPEQPGNGDAA